MFDNILNLFKKKNKDEVDKINKEKAKERLHLVLMQDRANVSADFLDLMKQEIIDVIKKYIDVDEEKIDVKLTNKLNGDGTTGAPALYANIPIKNIKKETRINSNKDARKLEEIGGEDEEKKNSESKSKRNSTNKQANDTKTKVVNSETTNVNNAQTEKADVATADANKPKTEKANVATSDANNKQTEKADVAADTNKPLQEVKTVNNKQIPDSKQEVKEDSELETTNAEPKNDEISQSSSDTVKTEGGNNDDKNIKNGNNDNEEKREVKEADKEENNEENKDDKEESKTVKMNKKKTTFFENVPNKKN